MTHKGRLKTGFLSKGDEFTGIVKKREIEDVYFVSVREVLQEVVHACVMKMDFVGARVV